MNVTVLGSGSEGNATVVHANGVSILIDAGFSGKDLEHRLDVAGVVAAGLAGIIITHDHGDHTRGMGVAEMAVIAELIDRVLKSPDDAAIKATVRDEVRALTKKFPLYQ